MVRKLFNKTVLVVLGLTMLFAVMSVFEATAYAANVQVSTLQQLKDAIAAAPATAPGNASTYNIEIMANIQLDGELTVAAGKNIKIWSTSPYKLKATNNTRLFTVNGALILEDYITLEGTGTVSVSGGGVLIGQMARSQ